MRILSKRRYLAGLQCPKRLWYEANAPEEIPEADSSAEARMQAGTEIGVLARELHPDGVLVQEEDFQDYLDRTKESLRKHVPLFEPAFLAGSCYCRVDILLPAADGWEIIEVKSSTSVKDEHLHDVSFQLHTLENAGLTITKVTVRTINSAYERDGELDLRQLFRDTDVTAETRKRAKDVPGNVMRMLSVMHKTMPEKDIGPQCTSPHACPLMDVCWSFLPEHNVTELYMHRGKAFEYLEKGLLRIGDITDKIGLNPKQAIQHDAIDNGTHIDKHHLQDWIDALEYPLYFLDFEAFNPAIPVFSHTHPYEQVPFQFSLHIQEEDGSVRHVEFLADNDDDPREKLAEALKALGDKGSIVAYNARFERTVIANLAKRYDAPWLEDIDDRFVDLLVPFRNFWYYDKEQHGSCSMKAVLPALTGNGYDMEINRGDQASREFLRSALLGETERERIRNALLAYCAQDTEGMIDILRVLKTACGPTSI